MELTRRDAVAALSAAGVAVGGGAVLLASDDAPTPDRLDARVRETVVAAAEVLYPSELDGVEGFVGEYVRGRIRDRPEVASGIADGIAYLDDYANAWYDERFAALDRETRDEVLRRIDADAAAPDPGGSSVERVRYYVVDELLFALYATPTGGELLGIENPPGHPGGITSYRQGPQQ